MASFTLSEADQLKIINKSAQVGNAHRLLPLKNITETAIETWEHCFMGHLSDQEAMKIQAFHFLWRKDDIGKVSTVPFRGVAQNITQLVYMMADNRIFRESVGLEVTEWLELLTLKDFVMTEVPQSGGQTAVPATGDEIKRNLDKVVNYITTDYYASPETPGKATSEYFADVKESRKAIDKVYKNAQLYLLEDLCPSFEDGAYENWSSVMKAIRRFFGKDECQETMIDRFKTLRDIVKSNKRMETKVIKFREFLRKFMVDSTDEKDWIKGRDFPDDRRAFQTAPERYGSAFATLFQYMNFVEKIPYGEWERVQTTYHGFLKEPTYKNWHENRPELYKIMDRVMKKTESVNGVNTDETDINYFNNSRNSKKTKKFSKRQGKDRKEKKSSYSNKSSSRQVANKTGSLSSKLKKYKCNRCSRFAKRPIAHKGPYGGESNSNCLYDRKGRRRAGYEAINKAEEESEQENDDDDEDDNSSGSDRESDNVNAAEEESCSSDNESDDSNDPDGHDDFLYQIKEGSYLPAFRDKKGRAPIGAFD